MCWVDAKSPRRCKDRRKADGAYRSHHPVYDPEGEIILHHQLLPARSALQTAADCRSSRSTKLLKQFEAMQKMTKQLTSMARSKGKASRFRLGNLKLPFNRYSFVK